MAGQSRRGQGASLLLAFLVAIAPGCHSKPSGAPPAPSSPAESAARDALAPTLAKDG